MIYQVWDVDTGALLVDRREHRATAYQGPERRRVVVDNSSNQSIMNTIETQNASYLARKTEMNIIKTQSTDLIKASNLKCVAYRTGLAGSVKAGLGARNRKQVIKRLLDDPGMMASLQLVRGY